MESSGILFGLLAMLGYGFSNALTQTPARKLGATRTVFYRNIVTSSLLLIIVLVARGTHPVSWSGIALALLLSAIGYIPLWAFMRAARTGKLGVIVPVGDSALVVTVLLSVLLFGEILGGGRILAVSVIFAGILLISMNIRDWRKSHLFDPASGVGYALIACVGWGIVFALWKYPVTLIGPFLTAFLIEFGGLVISATHLAATEGFGGADRNTLALVLLLGLGGTAGTLFYNLGISTAAVSVVIAFSSSKSWISALYGHFVHHERLRAQQYCGIAITIGGLVLLALL
jgi:drug/metabolite transporter (DMT)-like permease